ncbi:GntR family transcriptional regulator [Arthrobacter sp. UYP6]|uniref:GntR family transcriptional regulator n=1 Tax=Arthrobacter sp. UYP6 TaxID=1756378 RepID=UPI0033923306
MSARITVDLKSPIPPYEQIREQVSALAAHGVLSPGDRLPTIRMLASDLGVAPGTVARAYKELESAGIVTAMRRRGTVITARAHRPTPTGAVLPAVPPAVAAAVARLVQAARSAGLDQQSLLYLVTEASAEEPGVGAVAGEPKN